MQGIARADRFVAMDSQVADLLDGEDLGEQAGFKVVAEVWFVDQGCQVFGIGFLQVGVIGIQPLHPQLQRAPGMKTTGARGAVNLLLRLQSRGGQVRPVGFQEDEVGHCYSVCNT